MALPASIFWNRSFLRMRVSTLSSNVSNGSIGPKTARMSRKIEEYTRFCGVEASINRANQSSHSPPLRHSLGLLAMILPLHSVKPHSANSLLTVSAKGNSFSLTCSSVIPSGVWNRMPLS